MLEYVLTFEKPLDSLDRGAESAPQKVGVMSRKFGAGLCALVLSLMSLTACGVSDRENAEYIKELEERGFDNPVLETTNSTVVYNVTVNECRIRVTRGNYAVGWLYKAPKKPTVTDVDVNKLESLKNELRLEHCFD